MAELLLVDNDEEIRVLLRIGLEESGHTVREAGNGLEALRAIESSIPDILITDLIMPSIPGDKLLRILDAVPEWSAIPTIVISGVAAESPQSRAEVECDIYIAKGPIAQTLQYLNDAIREFATLAEMSRDRALGLDSIYSRHITRELLEINRIQQKVLDGISEGLSLVTADGRFVWVNQPLCSMVGIKEERLLGRSVANVLPTFGAYDLATSSPGTSHEFTIPENDRIVRVEVLEQANGTPETALIWRNVTDRLLMEEQFENIVESTTDVIWTANLEGYVTYISRSCEEILGFTREELVGRPMWLMAPEEHRDHLERRLEELLSALLAESDVSNSETIWPFLHADGSVRQAQVRTSVLRDRAGGVIGLNGVLTDITERQRLEREREALLHELHHRVRDNLQLITSLARLSEPERLEGRVAAVSYVFDELYDEDSFADIETAMLVYRVTVSALSLSRCEHMPRIESEYDIDRISMRIAVPFAIILQETVTEIAARVDPDYPCPKRIIVRLSQDGSTLNFAIGTGPLSIKEAGNMIVIDNKSILSITVDQLRGTCRCYVAGNETLYEVSFPFSEEPRTLI